jgi:hypothetical protein
MDQFRSLRWFVLSFFFLDLWCSSFSSKYCLQKCGNDVRANLKNRMNHQNESESESESSPRTAKHSVRVDDSGLKIGLQITRMGRLICFPNPEKKKPSPTSIRPVAH